jgi:hypothetical protein
MGMVTQWRFRDEQADLGTWNRARRERSLSPAHDIKGLVSAARVEISGKVA